MIPRGVRVALASCSAVVAAGTADARADPWRLRGDALATTASPVGLLTIDGAGDHDGWLDAEALVWFGGGDGLTRDTGGDARGDALVFAVRLDAPRGRANARIGRFVVTTGALRPLHLDGAAGRVRLPRRFDLEAFAGMPVFSAAEGRTWDWAAGGRVGRRIGDWGGAGVAFLERRDAGRLAVRELGVDALGGFGRVDLAGKLAFDAIGGAVALAQASVATRRGAHRGELFVIHRSPSHLVPATSLFSVLGDVPAQRTGARWSWRAAPRLDVSADGAVRLQDGDAGEDLAARATLRLDDRGRGSIVGELQRVGAPDGAWTGARVAARVPLRGAWNVGAEVELVAPDDPAGRGSLWPWALGAIGWRRGAWDAALAIEASASPAQRHRVDLLASLGRRWELR